MHRLIPSGPLGWTLYSLALESGLSSVKLHFGLFFFYSLSVGPAHLRSAWTFSWNLTHTKKIMFLLWLFSKWMLLSPFTSVYLKYLDCLCMVYNFLPLTIIYNCYTLHFALKQSCLPMPYLLWTCIERSDIFLFTPLKKMRPWAVRKFPSARQWLPQTTVAKLSVKTYW